MSVLATAPKTLMTAEEFGEWVQRPENQNGFFELVRGEVIELPPPTKIHGVVALKLGRKLGDYCEESDRFYATSNDSGVILKRDPDTVRGPDIAVYDDAATFAELHPKYGEVPPVVAAEVLSPNDKANKVQEKIGDYLRAGVKLVWVIDPEDQTVTVHAPDRTPRMLKNDANLTGEEILPGFSLPIATLFVLRGTSSKPTPPTA